MPEYGHPKKDIHSKGDHTIENVLIGTSGWSYKEWEKIFYPDSKVPKLTYYSGIFGTAEIDSTFYAYPNRGLVLGWLKNTPPNFEFSAKLPKVITHDKKLDLAKGAELDLVRFVDLLNPLKESGKLGPLLIQLPPSFSIGELEKLEEFFESLPKGNKYAIEFRNKSWITEEGKKEAYSLLSKYKIANTIVDEPLLPVDTTITNEDFTFIRWHGKGGRIWYNYHYSEEELDPWVDRVKRISINVKKIYGYFNNHFHASAVENSLEMLQKLSLASEKQQEILEEMKVRRKTGVEDEEKGAPKNSDEEQLRLQ